MSDGGQMDLLKALRQKELGIDTAQAHNGRWVDTARRVAKRICEEQGTVTADDVREALYPRQPTTTPGVPSSAGASGGPGNGGRAGCGRAMGTSSGCGGCNELERIDAACFAAGASYVPVCS
jgi:hypothetical protein